MKKVLFIILMFVAGVSLIVLGVWLEVYCAGLGKGLGKALSMIGMAPVIIGAIETIFSAGGV